MRRLHEVILRSVKATRRSGALRIVKWILVASALALLARALAGADLPRVVARIQSAGPFVLLGAVPYLIAITFDSLGWRRLFRSIDHDAPLLSLIRIRLGFDAIAATIPGGTVLAESLTPGWLRREARLPSEVGIAGIAARKCAVGIAQSGYLLASFAFGFAVLAARAPSLPWIVLGASIVLFIAFGAAAATFLYGHIASRLYALLGRLPFPPLQRALATRATTFTATDGYLARFKDAGLRSFATALVSFGAAWLMESLETWLFLLLLGAHVSPLHVLAFEASLSLLRCLVFFAPGGIGFQDVGYMAVFTALGVHDAATIGPAFVVLKRVKEIGWAIVGYALLGTAAITNRSRSAINLWLAGTRFKIRIAR